MIWQRSDYTPKDCEATLDVGNNEVLIVTDAIDHHSNLGKMVEQFRSSFSTQIEMINLNDLHIKGSFLGCISCGYDNTCIYEDQGCRYTCLGWRD